MVLLIYIFGCPLCHFVENSEFSHNLPFFEINDPIYDHFYCLGTPNHYRYVLKKWSYDTN